MDIQQPLQLLGGLTPQQFMKRHWQKKPLLVRQAIPGFKPLLERPALFDLAAREEVESRLLSQGSKGWHFRRGPFERRALPALKTAGLDAAGAGCGPARRARAPAHAAVPLRARRAAR
jgi:50S ribosomal protein L16 3-hydroxylase